MQLNSINLSYNNYSKNSLSFGAKTKVAQKFEQTAPKDTTALKQEVARINAKISQLSDQSHSALKTMVDTYYANGDCETEEYKKAQQTRKTCQSAVHQLIPRRNYYNDLITYNEHLKKNPNTAFLYDPNITIDEKIEKLKNSETIISSRNLSEKLGLPLEVIDTLDRYNFLEAEKFKNNHYFDINFEKNKILLSELIEKKDSISPLYMFARKYNFSLESLKKKIETGEIINIGDKPCNSDYALIDLSNPTNIASIKKHLKTTPIYTKRYPESSFGDCVAKNVQAGYLVKLGFGTQEMLRNAIQEKHLPANRVTIDTPNGKKTIIEVDLSNPSSQEVLKKLRKENPNVMEKSELAKSLKMRVRDLEQAMEEGKLTIIPEYLFKSDERKVFLDLTTSPNKEFVEQKQLDIELAETLKAERKKEQKSEMSLKLQIAWYLSPKTRMVASEKAQGDGYLAQIFEKYDNDEELETPEEITLMTYFRNVWEQAGTEEFSNGMKQANKIMNQIKTDGVVSIEDKDLRAFIEEHI